MFTGHDPLLVVLLLAAIVLPPIDAAINWYWNKVHNITDVNEGLDC
ncbi:MAG: hypothetical protein PWQ31_612 [Eubacteriales bacterium]|nr:hypothetical protein [Eubacteriales bacterium]